MQRDKIFDLPKGGQNMKSLTFSGSLLRQASMNSLNCLVKFPVSCGGLFFGMRKRTLIGCISELGGSPFANSMAVIPENRNKIF